MQQDCEASPVALPARDFGRPFPDQLANRLLEWTGADKARVGDDFRILWDEDQVNIPPSSNVPMNSLMASPGLGSGLSISSMPQPGCPN